MPQRDFVKELITLARYRCRDVQVQGRSGQQYSEGRWGTHTYHSKGLQWAQTQKGNSEVGWMRSQNVKGDRAKAFKTTAEKRRASMSGSVWVQDQDPGLLSY